MTEMIMPPLQEVLPEVPPLEASHPLWMRVASWAAIGTTLALAGCVADTKPEASPTARPSSAEAPYVYNPNRPADTPNIELGIIVATVEGASDSQGFNESNTTLFVSDAEAKITKATGGKVTFAKPRYYGNVTLTLPHGAKRCDAEADGTSDPEFRKEFTAAATEAAEKEGFDSEKIGSAGLIVFADYKCEEPIRSSADNASFSPENNILITEDLASLQDPSSRAIPHEIGHELGLDHANAKAEECPVGKRDDTCGKVEYGSKRSIMGDDEVWRNPSAKPDTSIRFNGYELFALGALDKSQLLAIDKAGVYDVTLSALQPGRGGTQLIRIPRVLDSFVPDDNYWLELSTGGRDYNDVTGCEFTATDVKNCDQPYRLSVALEAAGSGNDPKYVSHTYLQPLSPLYDITNYMALGGVMDPPKDKNYVIYRDEKSGLTIQLLALTDNRDRTGTAALRITLDKDL